MARETKRGWCKGCRQYRPFEREVDRGCGACLVALVLLLLAIPTFGLSLIPLLFANAAAFRCPFCGRKKGLW